MTRPWILSRRTALKGFGAALSLPLLDTMGWAEQPASAGPRSPVRLSFIYVPHGVDNANFWPKPYQTDLVLARDALPEILEPLTTVIHEVNVLGGLSHFNAEGDNRAHHARETATWLTGYSAAPDIVRNAISADQLFAQQVGTATKLPSLELGLQAARSAGNCDQGFSCAYHAHISWRSPTQPNPRELNPRAVFDRLFSSTALSGSNAYGEASLNRSILDLVTGSATTLAKRVGTDDRRKLDEYLDSVRSVEARIQSIERKSQERGAKAQAVDIVAPTGIPERFDDHARLMLDLIALAYQTDSTRVSTLMFSQAFGRSYPEIGVPENHHEMSHHQNDAKKLEKIRRINIHHLEQLAYFIRRLKGIKDGDGTLFDHALVLYGSGMGDGDRHDHKNLPTIVAGHGGGVRTGRYIEDCAGNFSDLLIALLNRAGCPVERFGDGTKALPDLA
jgi:hypothetical protein